MASTAQSTSSVAPTTSPSPSAPLTLNTYAAFQPPAPTTFIVIGLTPQQANSIFTGCRWAAHNGNSEGVKNEELQYHPDIFVCGPTRLPLPELWKNHQDFG
jgi:hypothetical protein